MVETVSSREQLTPSTFSGPNGNISSSATLKNYSALLKNSTFNQMFNTASKKSGYCNLNSSSRKYSVEISDCENTNEKDYNSAVEKDFAELRQLSPSPEREPYLTQKTKRTISPYNESERVTVIESVPDRTLDQSALNYKKNSEYGGVNRNSEVKSECGQMYFKNNVDIRKSQLFLNNLTESSPNRSVGSSFSIDSILSKGTVTNNHSRMTSTLHPGLHLSHLAAAASTFGASSADFLGKFSNITGFIKDFFFILISFNNAFRVLLHFLF